MIRLISFCALLLAATAESGIIPWEHGATFDYSRREIYFPTRPEALFFAREPVVIRENRRSPIRVYDRLGNLVHAGPVTNHVYDPGYYFVESRTDRTAFLVLPPGYHGLPHVGSDCLVVTSDAEESKSMVAKVGWTRDWFYWFQNTRTNMTWGQYDFKRLDQSLNYARDTQRKLFLQLSYWPAYLKSESEKSATRYAAYVDDVTRYIAAHSNGNWCAAVSLYNEPYYGKLLRHHLAPRLEDADQRLTDIYRLGIPIIRRNLPAVWIAGNNAMSFGGAMGRLTYMEKHGAPQRDCTAMGYHMYDCIGRPEEVQFWGKNLDDQLTEMRRFFSPTAQVFIDEHGVFGSRQAEDDGLDVLGMPYRGENPARNGGYACADWYDRFCGEIQIAAVLRKHHAIVIGHLAFTGNHDPVNGINNSYAGWFCGIRINNVGKTRGPRPGIAGFLAANHWLVDTTFVRNFRQANVSTYEFKRADGRLLQLVWAKHGTVAIVPNQGENSRTDIFGQPVKDQVVTAEPVLLMFP